MSRYFLLLVVFVGFNSHAVSFEEKEFLQRVTIELELLKDDIKDKGYSFSKLPENQAVNYRAIVEDLTTIQNGIKRRIDENNFQLSDFSSLSGEY
ncbi:RAQPRD family integrative conjugative element protein [Vibrio fluvialis]|nr:RAQPRD family integrative conjugative element protein [Vibrio fluvialis]